MIFNTSHINKAYFKQSTNILGKPFSLFEKIKIKGVGSGRFIIAELSPKLKPKNTINSDINYSNIELRPKGIIIHFTNKLNRYSWVIPYYRLVIYNTKTLSIHSNGHFIKFIKNKNYHDNKNFISKMTDLKNEFLNLDYYNG